MNNITFRPDKIAQRFNGRVWASADGSHRTPEAFTDRHLDQTIAWIQENAQYYVAAIAVNRRPVEARWLLGAVARGNDRCWEILRRTTLVQALLDEQEIRVYRAAKTQEKKEREQEKKERELVESVREQLAEAWEAEYAGQPLGGLEFDIVRIDHDTRTHVIDVGGYTIEIRRK